MHPVYKVLHGPQTRFGINERLFFGTIFVSCAIWIVTQHDLACVLSAVTGYTTGWLTKDDPRFVPILITALRAARQYDAGGRSRTPLPIIADHA